MPTFTLTDQQVIALVKQLPTQSQIEVFRFLLLQQWETWQSIATYGTERAREVAQARGYQWDTMSEGERELLIDQIIHEE